MSDVRTDHHRLVVELPQSAHAHRKDLRYYSRQTEPGPRPCESRRRAWRESVLSACAPILQSLTHLHGHVAEVLGEAVGIVLAQLGSLETLGNDGLLEVLSGDLLNVLVQDEILALGCVSGSNRYA